MRHFTHQETGEPLIVTYPFAIGTKLRRINFPDAYEVEVVGYHICEEFLPPCTQCASNGIQMSVRYLFRGQGNNQGDIVNRCIGRRGSRPFWEVIRRV